MANLNFNRVFEGGRLTDTPELKATAAGISYTDFTIAVNRPKNKNGDSVTDFIACVAWRQTAEFITKYFSKGSSIFVEGQLQTRSWTDQNGNKRFAMDVVVDRASFVDSKKETSGEDDKPVFEDVDTDDLPWA